MEYRRILSSVPFLLLFSLSCFGGNQTDAEKQFTNNNDGTITDQKHGLLWKTCSEGQLWISGSCEGKPIRYSINDSAEPIQRDMKRDGWRLPTKDELLSIVTCQNLFDNSNYQRDYYDGCFANHLVPTIDASLFPQTRPARYWSSSTGDGVIFHNVSFHTGKVYQSAGTDQYLLRHVKDLSPIAGVTP